MIDNGSPLKMYVIEGHKHSNCPFCGDSLRWKTLKSAKKPDSDDHYYECISCFRRYISIDNYYDNQDIITCINEDEVKLLLEDYAKARKLEEEKSASVNRVIDTIKRAMGTVHSSASSTVRRISTCDPVIVSNIFLSILMKRPDGNTMFFFISSDTRISDGTQYYKIYGYLTDVGRRAMLKAASSGDLFYYDGYNYEVALVDVINQTAYNSALQVLKNRASAFGSNPNLNNHKSPVEDEQTVYVYHKLNKVCSNHRVETVTAETYNMINESPARINVYHCLDCNKYFVNYEALQGYISKGVYPALNYMLEKNSFDNLRSVSELMMYGYNVKQGELTESERRRILKWLVDTGIMSKRDIINDLQFKISYNGKKSGNEGAKRRWQSDLQFVSQYTSNNTKSIKARFVLKDGTPIGDNRNNYSSKESLMYDSPSVPKNRRDKQNTNNLHVGCVVSHERFGLGKIKDITDKMYIIDFDDFGLKQLAIDACKNNKVLRRL